MNKWSGPGCAATVRRRVRTACGSSGSASSTTDAAAVPVSTLGGTAASVGSTETASMRPALPTGAVARSSAVPGSVECASLLPCALITTAEP